MANLIVLIGVPGSGKSTLAATLDGVVVSSDDIREELWGDADAQYNEAYALKKLRKKGVDVSLLTEKERIKQYKSVCNGSVFGTMGYRVRTLLGEGKNVIYDATNIDSKSRVGLLEKYKDIYDKAIAYYFEIPVEVAKERNKMRSRQVPDEVIERMYKRLQKPSKNEGFSEVNIISE